MKQRLKACVMLMLCAALLCSAAAAAAETALRAWVGYDTVILSGRWFPLFVEITANDAPVEGMVTVDIGADIGMVDRLRQTVSVPAGETRMYRLPICPMVNQRTFEVQLSCGEDVIRTTVRASRAVSEDALIIGVLGKETAQLAQALSAMEQRYDIAEMLNRRCIYTEIMEKTGASSAIISRVSRVLGDPESELKRRLDQREPQP